MYYYYDNISLMDQSNTQSGNVLFFILIAVALFAALSYAVTRSTRGDVSASRENLKLDVAELLNQVTSYRSRLIRENISNQFDAQIQLNNYPNSTGHVFFPDGTSSLTGQRIGLFHPDVSGMGSVAKFNC